MAPRLYLLLILLLSPHIFPGGLKIQRGKSSLLGKTKTGSRSFNSPFNALFSPLHKVFLWFVNSGHRALDIDWMALRRLHLESLLSVDGNLEWVLSLMGHIFPFCKTKGLDCILFRALSLMFPEFVILEMLESHSHWNHPSSCPWVFPISKMEMKYLPLLAVVKPLAPFMIQHMIKSCFHPSVQWGAKNFMHNSHFSPLESEALISKPKFLNGKKWNIDIYCAFKTF